MTADEASPANNAEPLSVLPYQTPTTPDWTAAIKIIAGIGLLLGLGRLVGTSSLWWRMVHQSRPVGIFGLVYFVWILTGITLVISTLTAARGRPRGRRAIMVGECVYAATYVLASVISIAQPGVNPPDGWTYLLTATVWRTSGAIGYSVLTVFLLAQSGAKAVFQPLPVVA